MSKSVFRRAVSALLPVVCLTAGLSQASDLTFEQRVAAQKAIEQVYWSHRIWPKDNPQPKPPLSAVMSDDAIRAKVADYLKQSNALEKWWQRPITGEQLQAEINRMARDSHKPETLTELYAALGNDPVLIAECLARPNLVSRLIRSWYVRDPRFHGELRRRFEESLSGAQTIEGLSASGGHAWEVRWTRATESRRDASQGATETVSQSAAESTSEGASKASSEAVYPGASKANDEAVLASIETVARAGSRAPSQAAAEPASGGSSGVILDAVPEDGLASTSPPEREPHAVRLDAEGWDRLQRTLRAWSTATTDTASTSRIELLPTFKGRPVVQLGPIEESDDAYSMTAVLDAGEDQVTAAIVSWAKMPFDMWWRQESPSISSSLALPSTAYALAMPRATSCVNDSWTGTVPTARAGHTAIWTGSEMIIWGGGNNTGGRYDPSTDTWRPTSVGANVPSPRWGNTAIWTGEEMVIWGAKAVLRPISIRAAGTSWRPTHGSRPARPAAFQPHEPDTRPSGRVTR